MPVLAVLQDVAKIIINYKGISVNCTHLKTVNVKTWNKKVFIQVSFTDFAPFLPDLLMTGAGYPVVLF